MAKIIRYPWPVLFCCSALLSLLIAGCQGTPKGEFNRVGPAPKGWDVVVLHEGDTVRIAFPGAPTLNAVQLIRRDGRVTLPLVGEFKAAGLTPAEMEKELLKLYADQLQSKEVNVSVESSAFPIYVTGAVLRPGRINADRPLTALEAVMEAGVDHNKANLKAVRVIRNEGGQTDYHTLNLKKVLQGEATDNFKLRPQDIIYVPEKFSWF